MKTFIVRVMFGFAIGLSAGSAFAATPHRAPASAPEDAYLETETFIVKPTRVPSVNSAMANLGLSEDVDFAWVSLQTAKSKFKEKTVNFVCYSADCHQWAKQSLRTIARAPERPEEAIGSTWRDASIDSKKVREQTEGEKIKARHLLRYTRVKAG